MMRPFKGSIAIMEGKGILEVSLLRAGVVGAAQVVVFPELLDVEDDVDGGEDKRKFHDRNALLCKMKAFNLIGQHKTAEGLSESEIIATTNIYSEIKDPGNLYFMDNSGWVPGGEELWGTYLHSPIYAAGDVFCTVMLYSWIVRDPNVSRVSGSPEIYKRFLEREHGIQLVDSEIEEGNSEEFGDTLRRFMTEKHMIAIALYRSTDLKVWNRYVVTCPDPDNLVTSKDRIFGLPSVRNPV